MKKQLKYLSSLLIMSVSSVSFSNNIFTEVTKNVGTNAFQNGYSEVVNNTADVFVDGAKNTMNNIVSSREMKTQNMQGIMMQKVPNAAEQGLKKDKISEAMLEEIRESQKEANNARQQGVQVSVATLSNPVAKNPKNKMLIKNWEMMLKDVGVSPEKTRFEASRLDKDEFVRWATNVYSGSKNN